MEFKGWDVGAGDLVAFQTPVISLPHIEAAVIRVEPGTIEVFSTYLDSFQGNGIYRLSEKQITAFAVLKKAEDAIPDLSGEQKFQKEEAVYCEMDGRNCYGYVVAAFNGRVAVEFFDRKRGKFWFVTGGAQYFTRRKEMK